MIRHSKAVWAGAGAALVTVLVASCSDEERPGAAPAPSVAASAGAGGSNAAGAGGDATPKDTPEAILGTDCDPLVPTYCGFPFPSSIYTKADSSSPTGRRLHFTSTMMPIWDVQNKKRVDQSVFADSDGFSPGAAALTHIPGATTTGLPSATNIALSITKDSPTLLIEADSGALVPHIAELDASAYSDDTRALFVRPAIRLKDNTRYIVAIRHVVDAAGAAIAPTAAFQALRDDADSNDPAVVNRRALYADIFGKLEAAGIDKSDLQIAWDYSTATQQNNVGDLLTMRDDALARVGADGPDYTITKVEENPNMYVRRRLTATAKMPCYLVDCTVDPHNSRIARDASGKPAYQGTMDVPVLVHIPNVLAHGTGGFPVQNGHGLLGSQTEGEDGYLAEFAGRGYVAFGVDLFGFAADDVSPVLSVLGNDIGQFRYVVERQDQGLTNSLVAMRFMRGKFAEDPQVIFNGGSAIDVSQGFYRGDSQGGIFGTTYMAVSTDVTRGLLGEPGMPYNLVLNRSADFTNFLGILRLTYASDFDIQLDLNLMQILWDRAEPDGFAPYMTTNTLPHTPPHHVLIHAGIGDYQVTPLGAEMIARTIGAKNLAPSNREVFGLDDQTAPISDSNVIVEYSFGLPPVPDTDLPPTGAGFPKDGDPHDKIRSLDPAQIQADTWFHTGVVQQACDGPCDPT